MNRIFFLTTTLFLIFFSCNNFKKITTANIIKTDTVAKIKNIEYYLGIEDDAYYIKKIDSINFKEIDVEIKKVSNVKVINKSLKVNESCDNWSFSHKNFLLFLKGARFSSKNEMMKRFYWEPCEIELGLLINNSEYIFILNKGYVGKLIKDNEIYYVVNDSVLN